MKTFATVVAVAAASAACVADAHTYLTQPLAEFKAGASKSSWVDQFSPPWTGSFKTGAEYAAVAPGKGFKNLRSFLEDKGPTCGSTLPNAKPKAIPSDGMIHLASSMEHPGPCEIWLDDTMAFHEDDCEKKFGSATSFKVDFSSCKGSCMLRFYWLGLQDKGGRWQSYKNCVPLGGGGAGGKADAKADTKADTNADGKASDSTAAGAAGTGGRTDSGGKAEKAEKADRTTSKSKKTADGTTGGNAGRSSTGGHGNGNARSMDDANVDPSFNFGDLSPNMTNPQWY